jgi:hypothetical protein
VKGTIAKRDAQKLWETTDNEDKFFERFTLCFGKLQMFNFAEAEEGIANWDGKVGPTKRRDAQVMASRCVVGYKLDRLGNRGC